jgi:hypothetical protein
MSRGWTEPPLLFRHVKRWRDGRWRQQGKRRHDGSWRGDCNWKTGKQYWEDNNTVEDQQMGIGEYTGWVTPDVKFYTPGSAQ